MRVTPKTVVVDSGPLVALFDARDDYHLQALEFVRQTSADLISTMAVITEVMYVLERNLLARQNLLEWIENGGVTLSEPELADFARIRFLLEKYASLPMDFGDAVVVALCERLNTAYVATTDSDFEIYRFHGRSRFINLFPK